VKPQLTKLIDQPPDGSDWLHEIKFDGYRMHARLDRGAVRLLTRTGLDWTHKYPAIAAVAVVVPYNGVPTLSFRLANERRNQILEAQVAVTLVRDERTAEGEWMRRFYDLQLARQRSPIFAMTFTVMHPIDPASPL
jgi:hypothetical protein